MGYFRKNQSQTNQSWHRAKAVNGVAKEQLERKSPCKRGKKHARTGRPAYFAPTVSPTNHIVVDFSDASIALPFQPSNTDKVLVTSADKL
jgi:hypothetical protein